MLETMHLPNRRVIGRERDEKREGKQSKRRERSRREEKGRKEKDLIPDAVEVGLVEVFPCGELDDLVELLRILHIFHLTHKLLRVDIEEERVAQRAL